MDYNEQADLVGADIKALQLKYGFDEFFFVARKGRQVCIISDMSEPSLIRPFCTLVSAAFRHVGNTLFEKVFFK
jgi:hypothetical protein